jgi:hypothetical protein
MIVPMADPMDTATVVNSPSSFLSFFASRFIRMLLSVLKTNVGLSFVLNPYLPAQK